MVNIKILKINMILMVLIWMVDIKKLKKKYNPNGFDINGKHEDTNNEYDLHGFDINGKHKDTNNEYDPNGFDIYYTHKDTDDIYDLNGFDINGRHKDTKNKYEVNGFDIKGIHRDTNTRKKIIREKNIILMILKMILKILMIKEKNQILTNMV